MAKKAKEEVLNLDNILFKCRDILRQAKNSGSFFEKRDMMLTLVFLRFIGEKYEDSLAELRQELIEQDLDPDDEENCISQKNIEKMRIGNRYINFNISPTFKLVEGKNYVIKNFLMYDDEPVYYDYKSIKFDFDL